MTARPKKVLYVVTKSVWGGAQHYVYDCARGLSKDRYEATIAAGGNGPLFNTLNTAGIQSLFIPGLERDVRFFKEFIAFWHLFKIFQREQPDVIHLNSTKIGALGAIAAFSFKLSNIFKSLNFSIFKPRIIFTVHGWGFNEDRPFAARSIIFFISWFSSLFHDKIILINRADYRTAQRFIPTNKLTFIPNGSTPVNFLSREEARDFLSRYTKKQISPETILIGAVAELTKNKGLEYMIDALRILTRAGLYPMLHAIIIGSGENFESLKKKITAYNLADRVILTGFMPDAARNLKAFDIFTAPSLKEGLPYVILEALQAGCPIVATSVGGIPDLVQNGENGFLVSPKNPYELAYAYAQLARRPDLRIRYGEKSRFFSERHPTVHDMIQVTIRHYEA